MRKSATRKTGRPRVEAKVDEEALRALVFAGCTQLEIADYFGIGHASVERMMTRLPMARVVAKARADRKLSIRRAQTKLAMSGNVGMLIWLGKQELGQREPRFEISGPDGTPIQSSFKVEFVKPDDDAV